MTRSSMARRGHWLAASAAVWSLAAAPAVLAGEAPPDPCAPSQFAGDTYMPVPAFAGQTGAPRPSVSVAVEPEVVVAGLKRPRGISFPGGGRILIADGSGLRLLGPDGALSSPVAGLPEMLGAPDVALDRDFARNRVVYLAYRVPDPNETLVQGRPPAGIGVVAKARLSPGLDRLEDLTELHRGGYMRRIVQAPDGMLLVSTQGAFGPVAQQPDNPNGKVLRIDPNAAPGTRAEFYSLGHRDPDGMTLDAETGRIWVVEHGPRGGDEVNLLRKGVNYGYPLITYGRDYTEALMNGGKTAQDGLEQPVYYWPRSPAAAGVVVYRGDRFPEWRGDLLVSSLVGKTLYRLQMDGDRVVGEEPLLSGRCERYRQVRQSPEGEVYVLTDGETAALMRLKRK